MTFGACSWFSLATIPLVVGSSEAAKTINEILFYGNQPKSAAQLAIDERFIAEVTKNAGTREAGSSIFVQKGWQFVSQGDANTAIKRFNQAWLLNPNNGDVFWGFGAALGLRNEFDRSLEMFEKARLLAPGNARLLSDYGRTYVMRASGKKPASREQISDLDRALALLEDAIKISPKEAGAYAECAIAFFYKGEFGRAWEMVHEARHIDRGAVDERFVTDLRAKMPEPPEK